MTFVARWLQQLAVADSLDAGLDRHGAWIIRRVTIEADALPRFGERLKLTTWCSGLAKSMAERTTEIEGDEGAHLTSVAIWVHMDPETRRPARLPEAFHPVYAESAAGARPRSSLRHPHDPPAGADELSWRFVAADLDIAGHVNNTMYWRLAEDLLPLPDGPFTTEAEYRAGADAGEARVLRSGGMLWVIGAGDAVAATLSVEPH
jgi:acyl-ACP thioesterase